MLFSAVLVAVALADPNQMNLTFVSTANGAVCLDGSAAGYYVRNDPNVDKWVIYIFGGGWCYDLNDCVGRANSWLGSSKFWSQNVGDGWGIFSPNNATNPAFASWNHVAIPYCDGASFSGDVDGGVKVGSNTIYFRGRRILKEVFEDLLTQRDLKSATEVLLTGCSAGGLSTFLHADLIHSWLPPNVKYGAVPDAGFFLNASTYADVTQYIYGDQMRAVFTFQNATSGVSQQCVQDHAGDPAPCIFAPVAYQYIRAPIFTLNSGYDQWQMQNVYGLNSPQFTTCANQGPFNCTANNIAGANQFRKDLVRRVAKVMTRPTDGFVIDSCWKHCLVDGDAGWDGLVVNGIRVREAVADWWDSDFTNVAREVDCQDKAGANCNSVCDKFNIDDDGEIRGARMFDATRARSRHH